MTFVFLLPTLNYTPLANIVMYIFLLLYSWACTSNRRIIINSSSNNELHIMFSRLQIHRYAHRHFNDGLFGTHDNLQAAIKRFFQSNTNETNGKKANENNLVNETYDYYAMSINDFIFISLYMCYGSHGLSMPWFVKMSNEIILNEKRKERRN